MTAKLLLFTLCILLTGHYLSAQQMLSLEKYGSPKTKKFLAGQGISYQLKGQEGWFDSVIEGFRMDQNSIILGDRYVKVDDISMLRFQRSWPKATSISLYTFGVSWSGLALVGTLTDGNPSTNYRWSDAVISGTSLALGFAFSRIGPFRKIKIGDRRKLRLIDVTF